MCLVPGSAVPTHEGRAGSYSYVWLLKTTFRIGLLAAEIL
jgi:hypothetical protein